MAIATAALGLRPLENQLSGGTQNPLTKTTVPLPSTSTNKALSPPIISLTSTCPEFKFGTTFNEVKEDCLLTNPSTKTCECD